MVKVEGPNDKPIYIIGTHMQANPRSSVPPGNPDEVRANQLQEIELFIDQEIPSADRNIENADIVVLGDLNIIEATEPKNAPFVKSDNLPDSTFTWGFSPEGSVHYWDLLWQREFKDIALFDLWRTTSPEDPGKTHTQQTSLPRAERLDYILMNRGFDVPISTPLRQMWKEFAEIPEKRRRPSCPQWVKTVFQSAGSDHLGVWVDFAPSAPRCSPMIAMSPEDEIPDYGSEKIVTINGELEFEGSMQWYRFNEQGTYSLQVIGAPSLQLPNAVPINSITFEVFSAADLSFPIPPLEINSDKFIVVEPCQDSATREVLNDQGCPVQLVTYGRTSGPIYVRVFSPQQVKGKYALIVVKHDCQSKQFACDLVPNGTRPILNPPPPNSPPPPSGTPFETWFSMHTEDVSTGIKQSATWNVDGGGNDVKIRLEDENGKPVDDFLPMKDFGKDVVNGSFETELSQKRYIVVERKEFIPVSMPTASWNTNIVFLNASQSDNSLTTMEAESETFGPGNDEIQVTMLFDDKPLAVDGGVYSDEDPPHALANITKKSFVKAVKFDIVEDDPSPFSDDKGNGTIEASRLKPSELACYIPALHINVGEDGIYVIRSVLQRSTKYFAWPPYPLCS